MSSPAGHELTVTPVLLSDPLVRPLLRGLTDDYTRLYGPAAAEEMSRYPEAEFAPPHGLLLLLLQDGIAVAGGAYRRADPATAELKRVWTHPAHRRRGLGRRMVTELENAAAARGYRRIFLTTGPRQPEARDLYLRAGYTPLFDVATESETLPLLPFEKHLAPV
ncbi:GNAT family N-acetyltransferase [Streptomyces sp. DSM 44915]|uniref:GNAT family N-acetyltransferase n=1 Tax=Streptomyces chisholmiae TaxID=3075540 RepID=A0ABU2JVI0_9ACTN|nr:GNAT family N-acetyltransferase [Streptomyces sp. DSM 44915]MDT0268990.1 GNAT family N-acetyltransferase [Streptomyces sp. DSM 44915]